MPPALGGRELFHSSVSSALPCSLQREKLQCHLFWEGESLLHIGWADSVKVARVHAAAPGGASGEGRRSLDIVASFQIDCLVAVRAAIT